MNPAILKFIGAIVVINRMDIPEEKKDALKRRIVEAKLDEVHHTGNPAKQ